MGTTRFRNDSGMTGDRQLVEKKLQMQGNMTAGFVDLEKAYDSPKRNVDDNNGMDVRD